MIKKAFLLIFIFCSTYAFPAMSQTSVHEKKLIRSGEILLGTVEEPEMKAVKINADAITLDGRLEEDIWKRAPIATGFTQNFPVDGNPATESTEIQILYTETDLIVGIMAFESSTDSIFASLFRRDGDEVSDWVWVAFDSYNDKRTAFGFGVNPRGVQKDILLFDDDKEDVLWNAVWEAKTHISANGWSAELRIPFSQLRFSSDSEIQSWGVNFRRSMAKNGEESFWAPVPRNESGVVSKFGVLNGLKNLKEPKRLEITPYISGSLTRSPDVNSANPYFKSNDFFGRIGGDIKYGLTSDLTLTATINPDFGQVEADPAVINLTANESFFSERRPFFLEGSDIFQFGGTRTYSHFGNPITFYSRRIGRAPQGSASLAGANPVHSEQLDFTTIAAAAKLSGKTRNGWSIGFLDAYTLEESTKYTGTSGEENSVAVEPASNYMVSRIKKDFNGGNTIIGGFASAVNRSINDTYFEDYLRSSAFLGGIDYEHSFAKKNWVASGVFSYSLLNGSEAAIELVQRSPVRYLNRVDSDALSVDPSKTSLTGYATELSIQKRSGDDNWLGSLTYAEVSPGYETNDLGFMNRADYRDVQSAIIYRENHPSFFQYYEHYVYAAHGWNFDGDKINHGYGGGGFMRFKNLWSVNYSINYNAPQMMDRITRGGPIMARPVGMNINLNLNTNSNKKLFFHAGTNQRKDESGEFDNSIYGGFTLLPTTYIQLSFSPEFVYQKDTDQYISAIEDVNADRTYGRRYVFSDIKQRTFAASIRLNWTFSPTMSLQTYIRPFISSADFSNYKEFAEPGTFEFDRYGTEKGSISYSEANRTYTVDPDGSGSSPSFNFSNPDFNYRSVQGNAVFRWEYMPGSTLFLVWQQQRSDQLNQGNFNFGRDFDGLLGAKPTNVFLIKLSYWFDS